MILSGLYIAPVTGMGRGVFSSVVIAAGTVVEVSPVVVMSAADRKLLDQTALHDYIFEWDKGQCCMAMGYVPVYNHSYKSNCEYTMDYLKQQITITTVMAISAGEELRINYNGDWDDDTPLWFDAK